MVKYSKSRLFGSVPKSASSFRIIFRTENESIPSSPNGAIESKSELILPETSEMSEPRYDSVKLCNRS